ncbi:hypothetical protein ACFSTH_05360 [Paenibacillus yanchengensis]|uniref:Uncharacterized protein n=1 Tax=Paenibacillus yanchengensis TaxID=2035833 RepID=A0ABW4YKI9_9BACL
MAFGIDRQELYDWKKKVTQGEIAFITHYWLDDRFPTMRTVTKVGCSNLDILLAWGKENKLVKEQLHTRSGYPHYDLFGEQQKEILLLYGQIEQLQRFKLIQNENNE